jgi:hypothetical protein
VARLKIEVRLPFLVVGVNDIRTDFRRGRAKQAGPYLVLSRACGLALDTGLATGPGYRATVWSTHAERHQLWQLLPTGVAGELFIASIANGLLLDATAETLGDVKPEMHESNEKPWQRWRLEETSDGIGYLLQSVHNGRYLSMGENGQRGWNLWFEDRHGNTSQQWLLALPHGRDRR